MLASSGKEEGARALSTLAPSLLSFRNIGVHIMKKVLTKPKTIVEDISGVVKGGRSVQAPDPPAMSNAAVSDLSTTSVHNV